HITLKHRLNDSPAIHSEFPPQPSPSFSLLHPMHPVAPQSTRSLSPPLIPTFPSLPPARPQTIQQPTKSPITSPPNVIRSVAVPVHPASLVRQVRTCPESRRVQMRVENTPRMFAKQ